VAATLRRPADAGDGHADAAVFLRGARTLWCAGVPVNTSVAKPLAEGVLAGV
jgi:hypothetical protein